MCPMCVETIAASDVKSLSPSQITRGGAEREANTPEEEVLFPIDQITIETPARSPGAALRGRPVRYTREVISHRQNNLKDNKP